MTIDLTPGYRAKVQIRSTNDQVLYERQLLSKEEVQAFIKTYGRSKKGWSFLRSSLIPLKIEAKDIFFPTFCNNAYKIKIVCVKFFLVLFATFAIVLDLLTLPIRLITLPFRARYLQNHLEVHPIDELIKYSDLPKNGKVRLHMREEDLTMTDSTNRLGQVCSATRFIKEYVKEVNIRTKVTDYEPIFKETTTFRRISHYRINGGPWRNGSHDTSRRLAGYVIGTAKDRFVFRIS